MRGSARASKRTHQMGGASGSSASSWRSAPKTGSHLPKMRRSHFLSSGVSCRLMMQVHLAMKGKCVMCRSDMEVPATMQTSALLQKSSHWFQSLSSRHSPTSKQGTKKGEIANKNVDRLTQNSREEKQKSDWQLPKLMWVSLPPWFLVLGVTRVFPSHLLPHEGQGSLFSIEEVRTQAIEQA